MGARNRIEVMHGVNLDQLGRRDPALYGDLTFDQLEFRIEAFARELGLIARFFQTNAESEFVEHLHRLDGIADGIVVNPGAWTHYAWAIRDALEIAALPTVEVHLSDVRAPRGVAAHVGRARAVPDHDQRARSRRLPRRPDPPEGGAGPMSTDGDDRAGRLAAALGERELDAAARDRPGQRALADRLHRLQRPGARRGRRRAPVPDRLPLPQPGGRAGRRRLGAGHRPGPAARR